MSQNLGRVKACTECRQQKQRCDAYKDYSQPCSRCKRLNAVCLVSNKFERRIRRTKADMQREIDLLRGQTRAVDISHDSTILRGPDRDTSKWNLLDLGSTGPQHESMAWSQTVLSPPDLDGALINSSLIQGKESSESNTVNSPMSPHPNGSGAEYLSVHSVCTTASPSSFEREMDKYPDPTISRDLGEVTLDGHKIDQCFSLFHKHYSPQIAGIFDSAIRPNQRFKQSPFLFWAIICTGSRQYSKDPTIFELVSKHIIPLALQALISNIRPIPTIQAIVLLCAWPITTVTIFKDPSPVLLGAAMQMAIQNGLHLLCHEADFASRPSKQHQDFVHTEHRSPFEQVSSHASPNTTPLDSEIAFRTRLWVIVIITFSSTSICDGLPFSTIASPSSLSWSETVHSVLTPCLSFRYKLQLTLLEAFNAIRRSIQLETQTDCSSLNTLIGVFDDQLRGDEAPSDTTTTCKLIRSSARLSLRAFHFYACADHLDHFGILEVYKLSMEIIECARELDKSGDFVPYLSHFYVRMVCMSAFCLLRISKSRLRDHIDIRLAEELFFYAVSICKRRSIHNTDLDAIAAKMLTQLWSSTKIFRQEDGSNSSLELRLRGRLSMSVNFDCFWWWRKEFGDLQENPEHQSASLLPESQSQTPLDHSQDLGQYSMLNEEFIGDPSFSYKGYYDWDWAALMPAFDGTDELGQSAYINFLDPAMSTNLNG